MRPRGYRPVWAQLRRGGVRVSEKVVRRLMREAGLSARRRRRRRWSSYAGEASPAPPNLPLREDGTHDFRARRPNELSVSRHHRDGAPERRQGLPEPGDRLLRRQAGRLVEGSAPHLGARGLEP